MLNEKPSIIFNLIYETLQNEDNTLSVTYLCKASGVSKSGYYNWLKSKPKRDSRELKDKEDFKLILEAYSYKGYKKGARSIQMRIKRDYNINWNIKKIRRLMKKYNLFCPIRKQNPYKKMARDMKTNNYASNILNRRFIDNGARMHLLTDITYIPFKEYFIYFTPILDACTKEVLAYKYSLSLKIDFVENLLLELKEKHGNELTDKTLIHSDQGCHYTSHVYIDTVEKMNLIRSMSRRGNCWDNAPQESFFGHMKDEINDKIKNCQTDEDVFIVLNDWINYYNTDRPIYQLNGMTPIEYYQDLSNGGDIIKPKKYEKKKTESKS